MNKLGAARINPRKHNSRGRRRAAHSPIAAAPVGGGATAAPERAASHATHSGHHEPSCARRLRQEGFGIEIMIVGLPRHDLEAAAGMAGLRDDAGIVAAGGEQIGHLGVG